MNVLATALRFILRLMKHPVVSEGLKEAVRQAARELIRQINGHSRHHQSKNVHIS